MASAQRPSRCSCSGFGQLTSGPGPPPWARWLAVGKVARLPGTLVGGVGKVADLPGGPPNCVAIGNVARLAPGGS